MTDWYLVYSKPKQERAAAGGLAEQGFAVYLPMLRSRRRRAAGMTVVEEPLFPRYMFIQPKGAEQSLSSAGFTAGVASLVRFGAELQTVPTTVVSAIKEREDPETGFHKLEVPKLKPGDRVSINAGPFQGIEAVFEAKTGKDRVILLLDLLGRQTRTEVSFEELER